MYKHLEGNKSCSLSQIFLAPRWSSKSQGKINWYKSATFPLLLMARYEFCYGFNYKKMSRKFLPTGADHWLLLQAILTVLSEKIHLHWKWFCSFLLKLLTRLWCWKALASQLMIMKLSLMSTQTFLFITSQAFKTGVLLLNLIRRQLLCTGKMTENSILIMWTCCKHYTVKF